MSISKRAATYNVTYVVTQGIKQQMMDVARNRMSNNSRLRMFDKYKEWPLPKPNAGLT